MARVPVRFLIAAILMLFAAEPITADTQPVEPTRESLLEAWENIQKNDPEVDVFEKVAPRRYRFKTSRFPYDGTIHVLNLVLNDYDYPGTEGTVLGAVELELEDLPEDFMQKYSRSYGFWQADQMLYFDPEAETWLTSREWANRMTGKSTCAVSLVSRLGPFAPLLFVLLFLVVLVAFLIRVQKKQVQSQWKKYEVFQDEAKKYQEMFLKLQEQQLEATRENTLFLQKILENMNRDGP
jgi:hypothetical protein